jgi:hypothetical protein
MKIQAITGIMLCLVVLVTGIVAAADSNTPGTSGGSPEPDSLSPPANLELTYALAPHDAASLITGQICADNSSDPVCAPPSAPVMDANRPALPSGKSVGVLSDVSTIGRFKGGFIIPNKPILDGTSPAVVSRKDGIVDMVWYNATGNMYTARSSGINTEWPWQYDIDGGTIPANTAFSPGLCSEGPNNLTLFAMTPTHGLYAKDYDGTWRSWSYELSNFDANSTPTCISRHPGNIELVYRNLTGTIIHRSRNNGVWEPPVAVVRGHVLNDAIGLVSTSGTTLQLLDRTVSVNDYVMATEWSESGGWTTVWSCAGCFSTRQSLSAATRNADPQGTTKVIDLVYVGTDGNNYWKVSRNNGVMFRNETYSYYGAGSGLVDSGGSPYSAVSPHHNRLLLFQEYGERIWQVAYFTPANDYAGVFRPSTHTFYLKNGTVTTTVNWGAAGDLPVTGDWDANGLAEVGVFRPSTHTFLLKNSSGTTAINWGEPTDIPVTGDWNGDVGAYVGTGVGVYRQPTHTFYLRTDAGKSLVINWGASTDLPVTGDWDGTGDTDVGVFRPSTHTFYLKNGSVTTTVNWGASTDLPVTGDWNADGLTDIGVFRPSTHTFYLKNGSVTTTVNWGAVGDKPVAGAWG